MASARSSLRMKARTGRNEVQALRRPAQLAQGYLLVTILLYLLGPTSFAKSNLGFLLPLLVVYQLAFAAGYSARLKSRSISSAPRSAPASRGAIVRRVRFAIVIGLASSVLAIFAYTDMRSLSLEQVWGSIQSSLSDPSSAYENSFETERSSGPIYWILVLLAPIAWSAIALAVAYFRELGLVYQMFAASMILLEATRWIVLGRNKGVFDIGLIIGTVLLLKHLQRRYISGRDGPSRPRAKWAGLRLLITSTLLLILLLTYFTNTVSARGSGLADQHMYGGEVLLGLTPEWMQGTLVYLTSYLTQGYYALSFADQLPWQPTFGVGHSYFLLVNFSELTQIPFFDATYQARMVHFGIDPFVNWHTMYLWFANDLHWLGVIPIMAITGWLSAYIVQMSVVQHSAIAYPLASLLMILIVYMPANNQVFSTPVTFVTFWALIIYLALCKVGFLKEGPLVAPDAGSSQAGDGCTRSEMSWRPSTGKGRIAARQGKFGGRPS